MPAISQADLARLVNVAPAYVSQEVKRNHLARAADKTIDTDLPMNAAWIKAHREKPATAPKAKAPPRARAPKVAPPQASAPEDDDEEDPDEAFALLAESAAEKYKLTKAKRIDTEAQTRSRELAQAKHKGEHIPRELVDRRLGEFDAALKTHFRDMPRRISAQVYAIAVSSGQAEVQAYLEREVGAAIAAALS